MARRRGPVSERRAPSLPRVAAVSLALHAGGAVFAAWFVPRHLPPPAPLVEVPTVDLTVIDAPEPEAPTPPVAQPEAPTPPAPAPEQAAARVADRRDRATTNGPAVPGPAPTGTAGTEPPTTAPPNPTQGPAIPAPTPSLRATDILRASNDATLRGASEGWILPSPTSRGPRDIFGGGRAPCNTPECLRDIAMAPTREGLAANPRDHRPAGSGRADPAVARRVIEGLDLVRSVRGLGRAVAAAPMHTVPGQRRAVGSLEGGVAEEFDQRHGASFSGMTFGATTPDIRYHLLRVELDVEQDAAGGVRSIQVSQPSGFQSLDNVASRALREALGESDWHANGARWSRWRLEVSDAVTSTPFANNDGWTVYGEESDGTRVRVRMRVIAQRMLAGADAGG